MIQLNVKTEYSLLNSIAKLDDIIATAKRNGANAVGMCDINTLHGIRTFQESCKKAGIKPVMGETMFYRRDDSLSGYHLELYAMNDEGFVSLMNLSTDANTGDANVPIDSKNTVSITTFEKIKKHTKGLICLTGGVAGELYDLVIHERFEEADQLMAELDEMYGRENVYIEITFHNIPEERKFYQSDYVKKLAKTHKVVGTNHIYYIHKEHALHRSLAVEMSPNPERISIYSGYVNYNSEFYYKTDKMMEKVFREAILYYPDIMTNTQEIADRCNAHVHENKTLPSFPLPEGETSAGYLKKLAWKGLRERCFSVIEESQRDTYEKRLAYEFDIINRMGFTDYFLIVQDFINWGKDDKVYEHPEIYFPNMDLSKLDPMVVNKDFSIEFGPGRGSAAGSLLAYCLYITNMDPIKYDLLFERFLNIERVSMPDIDTDMSNADREKVIRYCQNKYGFECVSMIATYQGLNLKSIIKALAKAIGMSYAKSDAITKNIPNKITVEKVNDDGEIEKKEKKPELLDEIRNIDYFKNLIAKDSDVRQIFNMGKILEGLPKATGKHACGVIIGSSPIKNLLPLKEVDGVLVSQYEKNNSEAVGALKMDFLGLQTLDIEQNTKDLVRENYGTELDLLKIPVDDQQTYKLFQDGETGCIFQFESAGMKKMLKQLHPTSLEHLTAANALYRPGPMEFIPDYIRGRKDADSVNYPHEIFKEVTEETYGILVYQEQIMSLVQKMAGFTLGQADVLRRGIGKKIAHYLVEGRQQFIDGAEKEHGVDRQLSSDIYDTIVKFANYGFNKSHACAYAFVAYQTAWLKAHYPECFMAANLTVASQNTDKLPVIFAECKKMGIKILPPELGKSEARFTVEKQEDGSLAIRYGLAAITGISDDYANAVSSIGDADSLPDAIRKLPDECIVTKKLTVLSDAGVFDKFGARKAIDLTIPAIVDFEKKQKEIKGHGFASWLDVLPQKHEVEGYEYPADKKAALERDMLHTTLTGHILEAYRAMKKYQNTDILSDILADEDYDGVNVSFLALVKHIQRITTRKGDDMAFISVEDETSDIEGVIFPRDYERLRDALDTFEGKPVMITGRYKMERSLNSDGEEEVKKSIMVSKIVSIENKSVLYLNSTNYTTAELDAIARYNGLTAVMLVDEESMTMQTLPFSVNADKCAGMLKKGTYIIG